MVVKVYISGMSGNKEVKKRQQRVSLILDSKNVTYEMLDISEPNMEEAKEYMQNHSKHNGATISDPNPRHPLPPQLFNDDEYCGDYDDFDMANEIDEMEKFLKLAPNEISIPDVGSKLGNGEIPQEGEIKKKSPEKDLEIKEHDVQENGNENISKEVENLEESSKEKSPSPSREDSKEKSPTPQKEKSPSPVTEDNPGVDNATDDQKAEAEAAKEPEETVKSEEA